MTTELQECIKQMHKASDTFYSLAVHAGNHAFIEFTGLINEYIQLCEKAAADGVDFRMASTHTGERIAGHNVRYIREKLECIYGLDLLAKDGKR